jgi:U32 family peptidase
MIDRIKPELLAPVGDMERLESALNYGADAVYLAGKTFGMRAAPSNFSDEELAEAVRRCHEKGVRVHVTCNTIPHNDELNGLPQFMEHCQNIGVDAFIIADIGVMEMAKKYAPNVDIHVSTQAGVINYQTANAFYNMGAKRVVLAREATLAEIKEIREKTPKDLEIEAFVHGAMCMSFSGRCLLSSYLTGRDANRGDCAQPCRWEYTLMEGKREGQYFDIQEEKGKTFIMNSRDMNMIDHISEIIDCGITSLKIEGRAKSAYYVACITNAYRKAIDFNYDHPGEKMPEWISREAEKISHREYSTGFYMGTEPGQKTDTGSYIREYEVVAICEGYDEENKLAKLSQRNRFFKGQVADVLEPQSDVYEIKLDEMFDADMNPIDVAPHPTWTVYVRTEHPIKKGAYLRVLKENRN